MTGVVSADICGRCLIVFNSQQCSVNSVTGLRVGDAVIGRSDRHSVLSLGELRMFFQMNDGMTTLVVKQLFNKKCTVSG